MLSEGGKKRLLLIPLGTSLFGALGWLLGTLLFWAFAGLFGISLNWQMGIENMFTSAILGGVTFVITYYSSEFLLQKYAIPRVFRTDKVDQLGSMTRLSIRTRLMIFFFAASILPVTILTQIILNLNNYGSNILNRDLKFSILALSCTMILIAFVLTLLKSQAIHDPVAEMKAVVRNISDGEFNVFVPVRSSDELGELADGINSMARGLNERERLRDLFGRAVDPSVRDHLLSADVQMGGEILNVTVLFTDLQGFTASSEKRSPEEVVSWLNEYFESMSACVMKNGGIINKYIGDAIMAVFGAPPGN